MFIDIRGNEALAVSKAANRQCEVMRPDGYWHTASSHREAEKACREEAQLVRLTGDARVLLEDILARSLPVDTDLKGYIADLPLIIMLDDEVAAIKIIQRKLS